MEETCKLPYKTYSEILFDYSRSPSKKTGFASRSLLSLKRLHLVHLIVYYHICQNSQELHLPRRPDSMIAVVMLSNTYPLTSPKSEL